MTRWLKQSVLFALLVYLGFGAFLYAFQRALIYRPTPAVAAAGYERITVPSGAEQLSVWRVNPGRAPATIYFGGNAEAVLGNADEFGRWFPDRTAYLVNYRGYGGSTGRPTEAGLYQDALAVFDRVAAEHSPIAVIGRSLGSGVATYLAVERPVGRLVLVTPFDSVERIAQELYPLYPMSLLLKDKFDSLTRAKAIDVPTLLLIAAEDQMISIEHARRLAAGIDRRWVEQQIVEGADHFNISYRPGYRSALTDFFASEPR